MADNRKGKATIAIPIAVRIMAHYTTVGSLEGKGPLGKYFDNIVSDSHMGQKTAEKAERRMLEDTITEVLGAANLKQEDIQYYIAGDLLNQIISSTFSARTLGVPFIGLYGACSTFSQALGLGAMCIAGGFADKTLIATSSHYQTAERQFRYPVELNVQKGPTNQFTVTGAGAAVLSNQGTGPRITLVTIGRVIDLGIKDANDMGAAMAPAAVDTLTCHLGDTKETLKDYDLVLTGDLGTVGKKMFRVLLEEKGLKLGNKHQDAGELIFENQKNSQAGGSGAACSAVVTLGYVLREMEKGRFQRVLVMSTGALMNALTANQGESIPCVCHAVVLEA